MIAPFQITVFPHHLVELNCDLVEIKTHNAYPYISGLKILPVQYLLENLAAFAIRLDVSGCYHLTSAGPLFRYTTISAARTRNTQPTDNFIQHC